MEIIDNINTLLGDDLKETLRQNTKLKIAASCFSIYAYEALKTELERIDSLDFIFTSPTFIPNQVTDKLNKEKEGNSIFPSSNGRAAYMAPSLKFV